MRVVEVIQRGTAYLEERGVESPRLQVELILAHVLRMPRLQLYLQFERELSSTEQDLARGAVRRRALRQPLQHILGTTSFCGLELEAGPDALIPRPETELLAERAFAWLGERQTVRGGTASALDWGTGSGCLAIALAVKSSEIRVTAIDISVTALALARRNAERLGVATRVDFVESEGKA